MHEGPGMNFLPGDPTARLPEWLRSEVASPGAGDDPAGRLADRLAEEMSDAWERGERPRVEDFLERHPGLAGCRAAVVRLVYEEICLHEELRAGSCSQVIDRFPQWHQELAALRECHRWIGPVHAAMDLPEVGESLAGYRLQAVLGRGLLGCVFRATQPELADRQVVLKVTPRTGGEHLSLARLQHPNIVPLYAVHDVPERGLRALCMPYLGGTTLGHLLAALAGIPPERRSGGDLLRARNEASPEDAAPPARGASIRSLGEDTYVRALCRIGVGLAEALQHAHRRGLVHLDLKPSNVLIAEDGRPMLLDFHLARGPIRPGGPPPADLGGTPGYMAPEQGEAMARVRESRPVLVAVDERADLYALGAVLYEALAGEIPPESSARARRPPRVSVGLADILARCLARDPSDRYPDAASLAADLRRHLGDLPLRGVANRSPVERWRKWRRRHPQVAALAVLLLASLAVIAPGREDQALRAGGLMGGSSPAKSRGSEAPGRSLLRGGELARAASALERAVERDPDDLRARLALGVCAYQLGRLDRAVVAFEACIALDPGLAVGYANRALALAGLGRLDEALSDCDRALTLAPALAESALSRGLILRRLGRPDEAADALEQALRHGAPPSEARYGLALLRSDRGDVEGARAHLLKALDADPAHRAASALLGRLRTSPPMARVAVHESR